MWFYIFTRNNFDFSCQNNSHTEKKSMNKFNKWFSSKLKFLRVNILTDRETKQMITTILRYLNLQYPMMIQGDEQT